MNRDPEETLFPEWEKARADTGISDEQLDQASDADLEDLARKQHSQLVFQLRTKRAARDALNVEIRELVELEAEARLLVAFFDRRKR